MLISVDRDDLHKIVVLNPKGGSGKTTLATNIAGYYAMRGRSPMLIDCDPQGYSKRWADTRPDDKPEVYAVAAYEDLASNPGRVVLQTRPDTGVLVFDLPAGMSQNALAHITYDADSILIPVLPSGIDIFCASRFIADLLLNAQIDRRDRQLAIVANRSRENTTSFKMLMRFLTRLEIPLIATLRDTQNYVHAAANGLCLFELPPYKTRKDLAQMVHVVGWLERWRSRRPHIAASEALEPAAFDTPSLAPNTRMSE